MNETLKKLAAAAAVILVIGVIISIAAFAMGASPSYYWDGHSLRGSGVYTMSESGREKSGGEALPAFDSMELDLNFYQLELIETDKEFSIAYVCDEKLPAPTYSVKGGTLYVNAYEESFRFGINLDNRIRKITISYPKGMQFNDIKIESALGDLRLSGMQMRTLEAQLDFGNLRLEHIQAEQIELSVDAGDCLLDNIESNDCSTTVDLGKLTLSNSKMGRLSMSVDAGDMKIKDSTANTASLEVDLGRIEADNFETNGVEASVSAGDLSLTGNFKGNTDVSASLGKIEIKTRMSRDQYELDCKVELGRLQVDGDSQGRSIRTNGSAPNRILVSNDCGDIDLMFG